MFGFGDTWPPDADTVSLVEQLVRVYIQDISQRALSVAELRGKLDKESFLYVVRKDTRKFNRVRALLDANEKVKKANRISEVDDAAK